MRWILAALVSTALLATSALAAEGQKGEKKREGRQPPSVEDVFKKLDANSDGKVDLEEFLKSPRAQQNKDRATAFFKKIAGDDGVLTLEELKAAREKAQQRPERGKREREKKPEGEGQK